MSTSKKSYKILALRFFLSMLLALLALAIILLLALPIGFYGMALYLEPKLPSVSEIKTAKLEMPLHIYSADNQLIGLYGNNMSLPVTFEQIPEDMINALLAAEDASFFEHSGISVKGLGRAVTELLTDDESQTGGSTITMQVAKNYFLSSEQTFERKITELFLSRKIESELSKSEILTLYVNKIYLGEGAYGIKAGARKYFSKSLENLSVEEYALLASMPKAPSAFNPVVNPERALIRRDWILGRMLHHGYISQDDHDIAVSNPITLNLYQDSIDNDMPYIAEMARYSLVQQFGEEVMNSGWRVSLTVDSNTQNNASNIVRKHLTRYDRRRAKWHGVLSSNGDLHNYHEFLDMHPAKILEVGKSSVKAELKNGNVITIPRSGFKWARGRLSNLLNVDDVVRVSPNGNSWKVVQAPEVQGSLVSINPESGSIIALVGGFHYYHSKFNRATSAYRQPGSTIKPLVYSAALEKGYTPSSLIADSPLQIGSWRPKNSDGRYYGPMELRRALYLSRNLVSIRLLRSVGTANALNLLEQFGLNKDELPTTLSLALGAGGATPLQMATAYATFANGGHRVQPYLIENIYDFDNSVLFQANPTLACASCFNNILEDLNKNQKIMAEKMLAEEKSKNMGVETTAKKTLDDIVDLEEKLAALEEKEKIGEVSSDAETATESDTDGENVDGNEKEIADNNSATVATKNTIQKTDATAKSDRLKVYPTQYERAEQATRILSPSVAYDMAGILRDVIRIGTAKKARSLGRSDIGGKTGTTNNFKDAWFSGFQPTNATVVWIGFDQPKSLGRGQFGGRLALPVWMDFMRSELKDKPIQWVTLNNEAKSKKQQKIIDIKDDKQKDKKEDEHDDKESLIDSLPTGNVKKRIAPPKPKFIPKADSSFSRAIHTKPTTTKAFNPSVKPKPKPKRQVPRNDRVKNTLPVTNNVDDRTIPIKPPTAPRIDKAKEVKVQQSLGVSDIVQEVSRPDIVNTPVRIPEVASVAVVPKPVYNQPEPKPMPAQAFEPQINNEPKAFTPNSAPTFEKIQIEQSSIAEIELDIQEVETIPELQ